MRSITPIVTSLALCCLFATGSVFAQQSTSSTASPPAAGAMQQGSMQKDSSSMSNGSMSNDKMSNDKMSNDSMQKSGTKSMKHKKHMKKDAAAGDDSMSNPASSSTSH